MSRSLKRPSEYPLPLKCAVSACVPLIVATAAASLWSCTYATRTRIISFPGDYSTTRTRPDSLAQKTTAPSAKTKDEVQAVHTDFTSPPPPIPDNEIKEAVKRAIAHELARDPGPGPNAVEVVTQQGGITLSGTIGTLSAEDRVVASAARIKGVRSVVDLLRVPQSAESDDALREQIDDALANDAATRDGNVMVHVSNGAATLAGTTDSWQRKQLFERRAGEIAGVGSVRNDIAIETTDSQSDAEVGFAIKQRMKDDNKLDGYPIDVTVLGGTVRITGTVASAAQKTRALQDAWVSGVKDVDPTGVEVKWWERRELKPAQATKSDDELARAIRDAFRYDPRLAKRAPTVSVSGHVATLSGIVDDAHARAAAEEDADDTVGVRSVANDMAIASQAVSGASDAGPSEDDASPEATHESPTNGAETRDLILTEIAWDPLVAPDKISVDVAQDGIATLTGTVDTWGEMKDATEDAMRGGARRVVNRLAFDGMTDITP